jgi:hypothetical protein
LVEASVDAMRSMFLPSSIAVVDAYWAWRP